MKDNTIIKMKNALIKAKVDVLYDELMTIPYSFKNFVGFSKWLKAITYIELQQLAIKIDILQAFLNTERFHFEKIVCQRLKRNITDFVIIKVEIMMKPVSFAAIPPPYEHPYPEVVSLMTDEELVLMQEEIDNHEEKTAKIVAIHQKTLDNKIQIMHDVFSVSFPMSDIFRPNTEDNGNVLSFKKSILNKVFICNRLEKELNDMKPPLYIKNTEIKNKILVIFKNIRDYSDIYTEEVAEYNRQRRNTLLMKSGMNRDVFRHIVSFMTMDPPPLLITV